MESGGGAIGTIPPNSILTLESNPSAFEPKAAQVAWLRAQQGEGDTLEEHGPMWMPYGRLRRLTD